MFYVMRRDTCLSFLFLTAIQSLSEETEEINPKMYTRVLWQNKIFFHSFSTVLQMIKIQANVGLTYF